MENPKDEKPEKLTSPNGPVLDLAAALIASLQDALGNNPDNTAEARRQAMTILPTQLWETR